MITSAKNGWLTLGAAVVALLGVIAAAVIGIVWGGFWVGLALSVLWGWFAVPLFGLPELTVWYAYGLVLMVRAAQSWEHRKNGDSQSNVWAKALLLPPFTCSLLLLVGWLVKGLA